MSETAFKLLLERVLADWPPEISTDLLETHYGGRYSIDGLYDLSDDISARYIGQPDEILTRNLSDAISSVIHDAAATCVLVRPAELRKDVVKAKFDERLKYTFSKSQLGWGDDDLRMVRQYFEET